MTASRAAVSRVLLLLVILIVSAFSSQDNSPIGKIPIGAIFDNQVSGLPFHTGFRYAVSNYNKNPTEFRLEASVVVIDVSNNYELATAICNKMAEGVFVLFGMKDISSVEVIESYSKRFRMPYVSPTLSFVEGTERPRFELFLRPDHTSPIIDMIKVYKWSRVHFVYDSNEGLSRLETIYRTFKEQNYRVHIMVRRLEDVTDTHEDLRSLDRVDPEQEKCIILDLSSQSAYEVVLQQISEVGMNKHGYHYLLGSMAFTDLRLGRLRHGGVNLTGFQLLDHENDELQNFLRVWEELNHHVWPEAGHNWTNHEIALSIDATNVIVSALESMIKKNKKVFQHTFRRGAIYNHNKTKGVPCNAKDGLPWMHGESIMAALKQVDIKGLTGRIAFDDSGRRQDYKLDVFEVRLEEGPSKVGNWTTIKGFTELVDEEDNILKNATLQQKTKIVTSIESSPFLMFKKKSDRNGKPLVGNDKYEGYCIDLAEHVAKIVGFDYVFRLVRDGNYGTQLQNKSWTGMIGELTRKEADLAIAPLTITSQREEVVDFSKPFMNVGISIMIKKPEKQKPGVFSFMEPLSIEIWTCIIFAFLGISVGLFLVSRFSPYEWQKDASSAEGEMVNEFCLPNSLWFSLGALMQQGSDSCPRSLSGRIIGAVWWFFVLIIISSYTANLAAFLTVERMLTPIESVEDLAKQTEIAYGTISSGTTRVFFKKSNDPIYAQMWAFMSERPSLFVKSVKEGVDRIRTAKGKYAFLLESSNNIYINNRKPCDTMMIGGTLDSKGFGIASPEASELRDLITLAVLELKEDSTLHKLYTKWWYEKGECGFNDGGKDSSKQSLSLSNVAGVFYILIGGLALAIALGVVEFVCKSRCRSMKADYMPGKKAGDSNTNDRQGGHLCQDFMQEKGVSTFTYTAPQLIAFETFTDGNSHTQV